MADLWSKGYSAKIDSRLHRRIIRRLEALELAAAPGDMNMPGFDFHALRDFLPVRYSIHAFEFSDGDAHRVDFEQYH